MPALIPKSHVLAKGCGSILSAIYATKIDKICEWCENDFRHI